MIVLIYSNIQSNWISCQTITVNLKSSYQMVYGKDIVELDYNITQNEFEISELAKKIILLNPKKLIFIDHNPSPLNLIKALKQEDWINIKAEIVFHVYGDFISPYPQYWLELESYLKQFNITFLCASDKQVRFIQQFVSDPKCVQKIVFPVEIKFFTFDHAKRENIRRKYLISKDDIILGYAGRITYQKNILQLIKCIAKSPNRHRIQLHLAGNNDLVGVPYLGLTTKNGCYFSSLIKLIEEFNLQEQIHFHGFLDKNDLVDFYHLIDIHIQFSTYNDEDFGMSACEGLNCGTPSIFSNWGGLSSFQLIDSNACKLLPVNFEDNFPTIQVDHFDKLVDSMLSLNLHRSSISSKFNSIFSIENVANEIRKLKFKSEFIGFNEKFHHYVKIWKDHKLPFKNQKGPGYSQFYQEIYGVYFE